MDCKCKPVLPFFMLLVCLVKAQASGPFSYVNDGELAEYLTEYGATYRVTPVSTYGFYLIFFNSTPNAYTLGIRMGKRDTVKRIVWTANRNRPVSDNATLNFTTSGDLVLSDADGTLVWSTNTSNKGAVDVDLLSNGNMVLYDKNNRTVWQSFDYPTDTLMVGQSLNIGGVKKLVSAVSEKDAAEGPYSLVMEPGGLALYASFPTPMPYWVLSFSGSVDVNGKHDLFSATHVCKRPLASITFDTDREITDRGFDQRLEMRLANFTAPRQLRAPQLCKHISDETSTGVHTFISPKFNTTLSFIRLEWDGNLRIHTYSPEMDTNLWDITFEQFNCDEFGEYGEELEYRCGPPRKCGSFGLCQNSSCVACPQPDGLKGWSDKCFPPQLPTCSGSASSVDFYKLVGAEHFSNRYVAGVGKVKVEECKKRCLVDCKCAAAFYWEESSKCFLTHTLDTLENRGNTTHLAFIKYVKKV